jgi:5-methylcytosine-specific restriction endonuclease McrA
MSFQRAAPFLVKVWMFAICGWIANHVGDQAAIYDDHAQRSELHRIQQTADVAGIVTTKEMVGVYDQRMAGKAGPGRQIYDAIRVLPEYGICPYCDHGPVSTLDHVLPKTLFPDFAVSPSNLVGVCSECNFLKRSVAPERAEEVFLHPYFDNVEEANWLVATVVPGPIAAVVYEAQAIDAWSDVLNKRVKGQFDSLNLARLYGAQGAREISSQAVFWAKIHDSAGREALRRDLAEQANTRGALNRNGWQAALYSALSVSDWFCDGGFRSV